MSLVKSLWLRTPPLGPLNSGVADLAQHPVVDPFMTLSFLALTVIPELKITDRGLLDVTAGRLVPLFLD